MATTEEEQLLVQSFGSMATDILAGNRSPYLAKFAPPGLPEELIAAAEQAQNGTLPKIPSLNADLVDTLMDQGLLPGQVMEMAMTQAVAMTEEELVKAEQARQTDKAARVNAASQIATVYPETYFNPTLPTPALTNAANVFNVELVDVQNKIASDALGYGDEIDAVTAAKVMNYYKPPDTTVTDTTAAKGVPDETTTLSDVPKKKVVEEVIPDIEVSPEELIDGIRRQWYDVALGDEEALAGLKTAGLLRGEAGLRLAAWQQNQLDEGWLTTNRPGAWSDDWAAGVLGESKARRLLERYHTLSNGIFGLREQGEEDELNKTIGDYIAAWTRYAQHIRPTGTASQGEMLARQGGETNVLEGKGAGNETWITRQIEGLPAKEQYMVAAGNALGPRFDDPTVKSYLNDRYSYEYGSYWLQGALNAGDLWVPSMLEAQGQEKWSRYVDRGFDPQEASLYRNQESIDTGWRNLVEASRPGVMGAELDYAEDPSKYAYGRIAHSNSIQMAAAMAKAGLTGQGIRGKMKLRGFMRIVDEYNQERAYKTPDDTDEGLASFLARKYGGAWA